MRTAGDETVAAAYSATGAAWQRGPGLVYGPLADDLVARCPEGVAGRRVLDVGAGTGAATRAALSAGAAAVTAVDIAVGMLGSWRDRPPCAAGDATALPFAADAFDAVVAAFSLNHVDDPVAALVECARVLGPGGGLAASAYADDDHHPAKDAADGALRDAGWVPPPWYAAVKAQAVPRLATVERAEAVAAAAGLAGARADKVRMPFFHLGPAALLAWRLGMAHIAPFLASLSPVARADLAAEALHRLGPTPPTLVRSVIVLTWTAPAA